MFPLDRELLSILNGLIGHSRPLFELALFFCGPLPLVACVATMLSLWWGALAGSAGTPALALTAAPSSGLRAARRRCIGLALGVAAAFVVTRLLAYATNWPRPLGRETLAVPLPPEEWAGTVQAMTGFGGFPSDHAALFLALAAGLFAWGRRAGWIALAVAVLLSTLRVTVGFHYPSDMLVGGLIGALLGWTGTAAARRSVAFFDMLVRLFDEHPAVMYPVLFVAAIDFTQHFRLVLKAVFYLLPRLLGA